MKQAATKSSGGDDVLITVFNDNAVCLHIVGESKVTLDFVPNHPMAAALSAMVDELAQDLDNCAIAGEIETLPNHPTLENWRLVFPSGIGGPVRVTGIISGHPDPELKDGNLVTTSQVHFSTRGKVQTKSRVYKLGYPDPVWVDELRRDGYALDRDCPHKPREM